MTVFSGMVSHKKGIGKERFAVATDNLLFAMAFGVSGTLGKTYSNQKIGMLQLEGETKFSEIAVDPAEMNRMLELDYARANPSRVTDFSALATALMHNNYSDMVSLLSSVKPTADISTLSNEARGAVASALIGKIDKKEILPYLEKENRSEALLDSVKRAVASTRYQQTSTVGGIEYLIQAKGTTAVLLNETGKMFTVQISTASVVSGSAQKAGKEYREQFTEIKKAITATTTTENIDKRFKYDPDEDIDNVANDAKTRIQDELRTIVRRIVSTINSQFADVENFNPASSLNKLWQELGITASDVPQTGISQDNLRDYASGKITALQLAGMPENNFLPKLKKAIENRFDNADIDALTQSAIDNFSESMPSDIENKFINILFPKVEAIVETEKTTTLSSLNNFEETLEKYNSPNREIEAPIKAKIETVIYPIIAQAKIPRAFVKRILDSLLFNKAGDFWEAFKHDNELTSSDNKDFLELEKFIDTHIATATEEFIKVTPYAPENNSRELVENFANEYMATWNINSWATSQLEKIKGENEMKNIDFSDTLREKLYQSAWEAIDYYLKTNFLDDYKESFIPTVNQIIDEILPSAIEEVKEEYPAISENTYNDSTEEYVNENYDNDYWVSVFESKFTDVLESIKPSLQQQLIILLDNTAEYADAEWGEFVQRVTNIQELARYVKEEDLLTFVETYNPEYLY